MFVYDLSLDINSLIFPTVCVFLFYDITMLKQLAKSATNGNNTWKDKYKSQSLPSMWAVLIEFRSASSEGSWRKNKLEDRRRRRRRM